jgi:hypothetical protein
MRASSRKLAVSKPFIVAALLVVACGRIAGLGEPRLDAMSTSGAGGSAGHAGAESQPNGGLDGEPALAGAANLGGTDEGGTGPGADGGAGAGNTSGASAAAGSTGSGATGACVLDVSNLDECALE